MSERVQLELEQLRELIKFVNLVQRYTPLELRKLRALIKRHPKDKYLYNQIYNINGCLKDLRSEFSSAISTIDQILNDQ